MFFRSSILALMLSGKKILIGVTGSIAAYKTPLLVRQLVKEGAEVKVVATPAALDFVSRLTLSTLSGSPVLTDLFTEGSWANHVALGRWADVFLVAPLSCNSLSKMASGQCDNLFLTTYLSASCPVIVAPAMDDDMWQHDATKKNLEVLSTYGNHIINAEWGELASGLIGFGRMAEPETIVAYVTDFLAKRAQLSGKKALVTAGPTYEPLDPVRFIGNHSSGKMGFALANELSSRGAKVVLVSGPVTVQNIQKRVEVVNVTTAQEMFEACSQHVDYDIAVMAAAVADYSPVEVAEQKIKKRADEVEIKLKKTVDILGTFGTKKKPHQVLVGFALETENENQNAAQKLAKKGADMMVLNSLQNNKAGFGKDTNQVTVFYKNGFIKEFEAKPKTDVAKDIVDLISEMLP